MRCAVDGFDQGGRGLAVYGVFGTVGACELELESGLKSCVFALNVGYIFVEGYADLLLVLGVDAEYGVSGTRDGVAEVAAVDFAERYLVAEPRCFSLINSKVLPVAT